MLGPNIYVRLSYTAKPLPFFSEPTNFLVNKPTIPAHLEESTLSKEYKVFIVEYMSDCFVVEHIHKQIKEFKICRNKNATPKKKVF